MEQRLGGQDGHAPRTVGVQDKSFSVRAEDKRFVALLRAIADIYGCPRFNQGAASCIANELANPEGGGMGQLSAISGLYRICLDGGFEKIQEAARRYQETVGRRVEEEESEGAAFMQRVQMRSDSVPALQVVQTGGTIRDEAMGPIDDTHAEHAHDQYR